MACVEEVLAAMMDYYRGDPLRINHFLKVYGFAKTIGQQEGLSERERRILEVAAVVHDIGIKASEARYGDASGPHQELLGPPVAEEMLKRLGFDEELVLRVSYLVGHHHTYKDIQEMDYQILVEADFLVNLFEGNAAPEKVKSVKKNIFRTETGKKILDELFV